MHTETNFSDEDFRRLSDALAEQTRQLELVQRELEETNRGVVALYAELDEQAEQLREASQLSESKFRTIYAQAPSGIILLDRDGVIVGANPALLAMLMRGVDQVVGQPLHSFAAPDWRDRIDALFDQTELPTTSQDVPMHRSDGQLIYLECSVASKIEPGVSMVVATDVSERRHLEQRRLQWLERERVARVEAEQVSRLKDDFIAILSHELRTPLNAILSWAHVLRMRGGTEEAMRGLASIERNGKTQARMISDLLDMSRLNLGKLPMTFSWIDPAEEIASAVSAMQPALDQASMVVDLQLEPAYRRIEADSSRLQQVTWNLLSNAIKFSPKGSTVRVQLHESPAGLRLSVTDSGAGIDAQFLPFVFDRFAQSDAPSNRHRGGLGLGLSIVRQLVEAHGGTVSVQSEGLGHGSTFTVWLPTTQGQAAGEPAGGDGALAEPDGVQDTGLPLAGLGLVVVDDDEEASAMLKIILGDRGASVRCASSAQEALALLQAHPADVLVSDIGMPGSDGYDLIRAVRRLESSRPSADGQHPRMAAIALTSFNREQDRELALACGFDAHCAKPLKPLNLIQQILGLAGARAGSRTN